ncbi:hypothetical protein M422DRAFT_104974, partial [Sphaerobolus stellatus SS14]
PGLRECPPEIVESIILEIDSPCDLLPLALPCKAFCQLIIPYHLQFRLFRL